MKTTKAKAKQAWQREPQALPESDLDYINAALGLDELRNLDSGAYDALKAQLGEAQ